MMGKMSNMMGDMMGDKSSKIYVVRHEFPGDKKASAKAWFAAVPQNAEQYVGFNKVPRQPRRRATNSV